MITDKLKELNNLLDQKIDDNKEKTKSFNNIKTGVDDIERKILEERLFQLERKAF